MTTRRIPEAFLPLFDELGFAHLATVQPDGSPHVSPMWVERDGDRAVLLNTVAGRRKHRNISRDPRVAVSVHGAANPYAHVQVRGRAELITEGGEEHIHRLSEKYRGQPYQNLKPGDLRVIVRVVPESVTGVAP